MAIDGQGMEGRQELRAVVQDCIDEAQVIGVAYQPYGLGGSDYVEGIPSWRDEVPSPRRDVLVIREQGMSPRAARIHWGHVIGPGDTSQDPALYWIGLYEIKRVTRRDTDVVLWEDRTPPQTLWNLAEAVHDMYSFFRFVAALSSDAVELGEREDRSDEWAHGTIADYLDGALRAASFTEFGTRNGMFEPPPGWPEQPSWQAFARFLIVGKIYE